MKNDNIKKSFLNYITLVLHSNTWNLFSCVQMNELYWILIFKYQYIWPFNCLQKTNWAQAHRNIYIYIYIYIYKYVFTNNICLIYMYKLNNKINNGCSPIKLNQTIWASVNCDEQFHLAFKSTSRFLAQNSELELYLLYTSTLKHIMLYM